MYRTMKADADGGPTVGTTSSTLGVRLDKDIPVGADGFVEPKTGECPSRSMTRA